MAKSVALISLYPLTNIGGGERYTFSTCRAIESVGDHCSLFARSHEGPGTLSLVDRLQMSFTETDLDTKPISRLAWRDLLLRLAQFDIIWVHQYLSCDVVFDIIAAVTSDQTLLFTNLGHEVLFSQFQAFYCRAPNHYFIEISKYAAERSKYFRGLSFGITGAIWSSQFAAGKKPDWPNLARRACSVGRVLPHKGLEVTISGLPDEWELTVIGPCDDAVYLAHLKSLIGRKQIRFTGSISEENKQSIISEASCLVASSCQETYDGRNLPQAELLGLVIFEAIADGVLPITSDIPSFSEVMTKLGLSNFIYPARNSQQLRKVLCSLESIQPENLSAFLRNAEDEIRRNYLWDDYWSRVLTCFSQ